MPDQRLPHLDGLRFIAAATVVLAHVETVKKEAGLPFLQNRFLDNAAQLAVTFFFVLSGFLIFWRLQQQTQGDMSRIDLWGFYRKRIFRTFPLYYLVVFLSVVIGCLDGSLFMGDAHRRLLLYVWLLPNTANVLYGASIHLGPAWSLAVELCFYLLFPFLLYCTARLPAGRVLFWLLVASMAFSLLFYPLLTQTAAQPGGPEWLPVAGFYVLRYRLYAFASGAMAAYLYNKIPLKGLGHTAYLFVRVAFPLAMAIAFLGGVTFSSITQQLYSVLFAVLIWVMVQPETKFDWLEHRWLVWGGRISYGIYLLHMLVVPAAVQYLTPVLQKAPVPYLLHGIAPLLLAATILLASMVYQGFERPLMKWMRRER